VSDARIAGRAAEMAALDEALDDAHRGHTRVVLVGGDAGIGKTHLVEAFAQRARGRGSAVAFGRAWEGGGAPELWPWIDALRSLGVDDAVAVLEGGAGDADEAGARFRKFDRVTTALRCAPAAMPTVVVLEDLHVADESTIRLAHFVARTVRDVPLLVVGTRRDVDRQALAELARDATVLDLERLDDAHIAAMVDADIADRVVEAAGGNPFFARALERYWRAGGTGVPSTVRDLLDDRLRRLPEETLSALRVAAVLGRGFDLDIVARALAIGPEPALSRLSPAVQAHLVERDGTQWRFIHDLVRATIVDALEPLARAQHHVLVAEALDADGRAAPAVLAHHGWEAAGVVDRARAAAWARAAAEHAEATLAYEDAARHWGRAAELADDPVTRWSHLSARGAALRLAGDFNAARRAYFAAADLAAARRDADAFAESVLGAAGFAEVGYDPEVLARHERALEGLPPGDGRLRALVLSNLASFLSHSDRFLEGIEMSSEALAMARRIGDRRALATVLFNHHYLLIMDSRRRDERLMLARELLAVAEELRDSQLRVNSHVWLAHDLLELGDVVGCERELARAGALSMAARLPFGLWAATYPRAFLALCRDQLDLAEQLADEALAHGAPIGFADVSAVDATFRFHLHRARGRMADMAASEGADIAGDIVLRSFVALGLAEMGLLDEARPLVRSVVEDGERTLQFEGSRVLVAEACVLVGDAESARALYDELAHIAGSVVTTVICASPHGHGDRLLGDLAATFGDLALAAQHHEIARAFHEAVGFRRFLRSAPVDGVPPPTVAPARTSTVRLDGEYWTFEHGGRTSRVKDSPGVRHLATLLRAPGREHHALDLAGGGVSLVEGGVGPLLDEQAKDAFRARLIDLQDEVDDARAANDLVRGERAQAELDALVDQLAAAVGLGGRDRDGAASAERARQSVTRAVKRAIDRLADADPALGEHLRATVRAGIYSVYRPDPAAPVVWSA